MDPFLLFAFRVCLCHTVLSVPCSHVVTCWEKTGLLAVLCMMFSCVLSLSHMVSWVRYGTWLYQFLIFVFSFTLFVYSGQCLVLCLCEYIAQCISERHIKCNDTLKRHNKSDYEIQHQLFKTAFSSWYCTAWSFFSHLKTFHHFTIVLLNYNKHTPKSNWEHHILKDTVIPSPQNTEWIEDFYTISLADWSEYNWFW